MRKRAVAEDETRQRVTFKIVPANASPCPVEVEPHYHQIDLYLGCGERLHELWEPDHGKRLEQLRDRLKAVLRGGYTETLRPREDGRGLEFVGTFETAHGFESYWHYLSPGSHDYGALGRTTYAPYEAATSQNGS